MGVDDIVSPTTSNKSPEKSNVSKLVLESTEDGEVQERNHFQASELSLEEFDKNLPSTVRLLTTSSGAKVYVIGTAHFSLESQEEVAKVIQNVKPHLVMVELCPSRYSILTMDEEAIEREAKNMSFEKIRNMLKEHGTVQGLMYILLQNLSAQLTRDLGMAPGGEFRRALTEVKKLGNCIIQFGDRPISITIKRALSVLSWWKSIRLMCTLVFSNQTISKEDVESFKQKDLLESMLAEIAGTYPELNHVFLEERDIFLTYSLQLAANTVPRNLQTENGDRLTNADEPMRVVGIVGLGHANGIARHWQKITDDMIPPLMLVPPRSRSSKVIATSFKLASIGLLCWGCYKLIPVPKVVNNVVTSFSLSQLFSNSKFRIGTN